jgi:hypothetical protein
MRFGLLCALLASGCAMRGPLMAGSSDNSAGSSGNSANSSGQSGNSSGQSGNSSAQSGGSSNSQSSAQSGQSSNGSAASSNGSAASSQGSAQSSNNSNQSSQGSANSNQSSNTSSQNSSQSSGTSQATTQSSQNSWSQVAVASALLSAVGGGITTTVYSVRWRREARLAQEELKRLQQGPQQGQPQPQPMPYKVEPIPVQPGPAPAPAPAPPPDPGFAPAPFPKKTELLRDDEPRFDAMIQARSWLLANELQLRQDLALGAGPTVMDLAGVAGIRPEHRAHFGRVLQKHRALFKVTAEVTPEEAAKVFSQVGDLVMTDVVLRPDGLAVLAELH